MYAKVFQYKFPSVTEAKVAASFCSDNLGKKITKYHFQSLNIMIGKEGDLSIFIKFLISLVKFCLFFSFSKI